MDTRPVGLQEASRAVGLASARAPDAAVQETGGCLAADEATGVHR